jgi:hypothetical protein
MHAEPACLKKTDAGSKIIGDEDSSRTSEIHVVATLNVSEPVSVEMIQ